MAPSWLIELYVKQYPNMPIEDCIELANTEWKAYEADMQEGGLWD
jgi:hypothetical protein